MNAGDRKRTHAIEIAIQKLKEDTKGFVLPNTIPKISSGSLTPLKFHRDYVSKNQPVIITDALASWPALKKWNLTYLEKKLSENMVTVDLTPNGFGDAITSDGLTFVTPAQQKMRFTEFANMLRSRESGVVAYCQKQNGNFTEEFTELHDDVKRIDWAFDAFASEPDAVNMWIGDNRSVSSLHRDPYENIYCVITGQKRFTLLPPTDTAFLGEQDFPSAQYHITRPKDGSRAQWKIVPEYETDKKTRRKVKWIPVDVDFPNRIDPKSPCLTRARPQQLSPLRCVVNAGDVLYLPSLWFHQVSQQDTTIAVNYWFDMHFGLSWTLIQYLEQTVDFARQMQDDTSRSHKKQNAKNDENLDDR